MRLLELDSHDLEVEHHEADALVVVNLEVVPFERVGAGVPAKSLGTAPGACTRKHELELLDEIVSLRIASLERSRILPCFWLEGS
jgi:hypothetical protein